MRNKEIREFNYGQIIVVVILALALLMTIGVALILHSRSWRSVARVQTDSDQAFSLARTGIERGEKEFNDRVRAGNFDTTPYSKRLSLDKGTIDLKIDFTLENNLYSAHITSVGKYNTATRTLERRKTFKIAKKSDCFGWMKLFSNKDGYIYSTKFREVTGNNYIVGGNYIYGSERPIFVLRLNNGELDRNFGGKFDITASFWEFLNSLQVTTDNGFILGGGCNFVNLNNMSDFFVIRLRNDGTLDTNFGTGEGNTGAISYNFSKYDSLNYLQQTNDGGFILGGVTYQWSPNWDILVIKTDSNGGVQWARQYGGPGKDQLRIVQQTADGGYIIGGDTLNSYTYRREILVIKIKADGTFEWARRYGQENVYISFGCLRQTDDNNDGQADDGYILGGTLEQYGNDFLLIKINANGEITWQREYDFNQDFLFSVSQTNDRGYILGGMQIDYESINSNFFLIKTDENGNLSWAKRYCEEKEKDETGVEIMYHPNSLAQTLDGNYILVGTTDSTTFTGVEGINKSSLIVINTNNLGELGCCSYVEDVSPYVTLRAVNVTANEIAQGNIEIPPDHPVTAANLEVTISNFEVSEKNICPQQ